MSHIFFRIVFAAAALLLQTSIAFACTCAPKRPVLDEYEWVQVVMTGCRQEITGSNLN